VTKRTGGRKKFKNKNRNREKNQEYIVRQNSNSISAIALIYNIKIMNLGIYFDIRSLLRPPGARSGSPGSFLPGIDALGNSATGEGYIPGKKGEQK
jgi:hypothetical protein